MTRQHELDACGKPVTTLIRYQWDGETFTDGACTYHAHRMGGSLPLTVGQVDLLTKQIASAEEMDALRSSWVGA